MSFQTSYKVGRHTKNQSFAGALTKRDNDSDTSSIGGYAFGSSMKPKATTRSNLGPGSYNTNSKLIQKSSSAAGIGIGTRKHQKQDLSKTLGPGDYQANSKLVQKKSSAAGIGIGKRSDVKKSNCLHGPGFYTEHMNTFGKDAKGGGAAWRAPKLKKQEVKTPGPGDYI